MAAILLAGAVVGAALLWHRPGSDEPTPVAAGLRSRGTAASTPASAAPFEQVTGRWLRLDGGYVLELRAIDASGAVDAAYLNPQPIHVAKAEVTLEGSTPKVLVELRAPNYPGSTYTLTYDAQRDQLRGAYFQAALQQRFDVEFVRMKEAR